MFRNAGRNSVVLFKDLRVLSTNALTPSGYVVFKREWASSRPDSCVADDTKQTANQPSSVKVWPVELFFFSPCE